MSLSLTEDIKTMAELEQNPRAVLNQLRRTGRPVVLTVKGKPDAVLMDVETYEHKLKVANLAQLLLQGEADIAGGRTRPAREVLKELKRGARKVHG